jgi:hypothetical protein
MANLVKIKCEFCGGEFERLVGEVNRAKKLGRKFFCSRKCGGSANVGNLPDSQIGVVPTHLTAANRLDEYSPFRIHFLRAKDRAKTSGRAFEISLSDLKGLWEKQNGICPYTGWEMILHPSCNIHNSPAEPNRASLDRIDSSEGYVNGNIQFVSYMANLAKNRFSEEQLVGFCGAVVKKLERMFP